MEALVRYTRTVLGSSLRVMNKILSRSSFAAGILAAGLMTFTPLSALAMPGFLAGKGSAERSVPLTHVAILKAGESNIVSVMPHYSGPISNFAVVLLVPKDVKLENVTTLERAAIEHLDTVSAPRFHEFWEMEPCETAAQQQTWEIDLKVKGAEPPPAYSDPAASREMRTKFEPAFVSGEYRFSLASTSAELSAKLNALGFKGALSEAELSAKYSDYQYLIAEVDTAKISLTGATAALLSPIRFITNSDYTVPLTAGLASADGGQESVIYVLDREKAYAPANYDATPVPTNLKVKFDIKEKMGEFYAGLHDAMLAKDPNRWLIEYAWKSDECGQPCSVDPIYIDEIMGLGGDVFEATLEEAERSPEAPEMTESEAAAYKELDTASQKILLEQRAELSHRKAILSRQKYVISRFHHRYSKEKGLTKDLKIAAAPAMRGGIQIPTGAEGTLVNAIDVGGELNQMQARYVNLHNTQREPDCAEPKFGRWGKPPMSYRGAKKIWQAMDTAMKKRG